MLIFTACFVIGIVLNMLNTIYRKVGSVILHYFRSEESKAQWYSVVCLWPYNYSGRAVLNLAPSYPKVMVLIQMFFFF